MSKVYYNSPCSQCFYNEICGEGQRAVRELKISIWKQSGQLIRISSTDCFISPEKRQRDFNCMPDYKQKQVAYDRAYKCYGHYVYQHSDKCKSCSVCNECKFIDKISGEIRC